MSGVLGREISYSEIQEAYRKRPEGNDLIVQIGKELFAVKDPDRYPHETWLMELWPLDGWRKMNVVQSIDMPVVHGWWYLEG